jgi:hypothetical protein
VVALGGLGLAALGTFAFFGTAALVERDNLYDCRPTCTQGRVDEVDTKYTIANVSLGVALIALAGATAFYVTRPARQSSPVRASNR